MPTEIPQWKTFYDYLIPCECFIPMNWDSMGMGRNLMLETVANGGRRSPHPAWARLNAAVQTFNWSFADD